MKVNKYMYLYHGTSSEKINDILKYGLSKPYLTSEYEIAKYYGECTGECNPVILKVKVNVGDLIIDWCSIDEPVGYGNVFSTELEQKAELYHNDLRNNKLEWYDKNGIFSIPNSYYQYSLDTVKTCRCNVNISSKNIEICSIVNS